MNRICCLNCRYWQEYPHGNGTCHLNPPVMITNSNGHVFPTQWPETATRDWCGEASPKNLNAAGVDI